MILILVCKFEKGFQKEQSTNLLKKWKLMEPNKNNNNNSNNNNNNNNNKIKLQVWLLAIEKFSDQQKDRKEIIMHNSQIRAWINPKTNSK